VNYELRVEIAKRGAEFSVRNCIDTGCLSRTCHMLLIRG